MRQGLARGGAGGYRAPAAGTPLLLELPAAAVAEPTHYVLSLTDSAS